MVSAIRYILCFLHDTRAASTKPGKARFAGRLLAQNRLISSGASSVYFIVHLRALLAAAPILDSNTCIMNYSPTDINVTSNTSGALGGMLPLPVAP